MNMQPESHICGLSFFIITLDGISKTIYGTKNIVNAVLYSTFFNFRSATSPKDRALAILMRSRKASR